jgi:hypothetical protein
MLCAGLKERAARKLLSLLHFVLHLINHSPLQLETDSAAAALCSASHKKRIYQNVLTVALNLVTSSTPTGVLIATKN